VKSRVQPLRNGDPKNFQGWALKGLIGEGGQSTIYLAEKKGKKAALKMIRKDFLHNQKAVDRFFTEITNLEKLDHPNIACVLEVENSGSFFAIEFIDGLNLENFIEEVGPLEIKQWWKFAEDLARTIEYCHSKGIIHKDISPRNIVVGPDGPVLIDFGISYLEKDPRLTSIDEIVGTPPFMSPEHFGTTRPKEMDNFSLAGTLIFAATGHYPFSGSTSAEWKESILFRQPDFKGLSDDQRKVLSPLLYKNPELRGSLTVFSQILEEIISGKAKSEFLAGEFAKVDRESQNKLILEKKQLAVKSQTVKKVVASATTIVLLSVGMFVFGIFALQNNLFENTTGNSQSTEVNSDLTADPPIEVAKPNTPLNSKQATPSATPIETNKPITSSDSFKISAPISAKVQIAEIFGRVFKNGLNYWVIPLTNFGGEKVPAITSTQFRLIGFPDAGWLDVPYKLKTDAATGTVYAEVDDFLFAVIFKDQKYCPEFRIVSEKNGEIVQIWNKGQPDCATDYIP
jgi:serine/threonine protein kinase